MTPQETVERALAAARCEDCIVIADETSTANLRWAANSLTTNGVARSRQLTVIAIARGAGGPQAGVVSRAGVRADQVADVVAAAESAASQSSPAEDAQPLLGPGDPEAFGVKEGPGARPARLGRRAGQHRHRRVHQRSRQLSARRSGRQQRPGGSCTGTPSTR